jgi:hypothetical protein
MSAFLLAVAGLIVLTGVAVLLMGRSLPVRHVARVRAVIEQPLAEVWDTLSRFEAYPEWRGDLASVVSGTSPEGRPVWTEVSRKGQRLSLETMEEVSAKRLVRRIADRGLPFGGSWTIEVDAVAASRTALTVVEDGEVYNPFFRFVSRFLLGHDRTIRAFVADVARKHGQSPQIEVG